MEGVNCGREAHSQTAGAVKSERLSVDGSSPVVLLRRMNWKERHLGPVKTAAEAALVGCMSILKGAG